MCVCVTARARISQEANARRSLREAEKEKVSVGWRGRSIVLCECVCLLCVVLSVVLCVVLCCVVCCVLCWER